MPRADVVAELAEAILALDLPHPTRVAVDGPDAAGKTTLGDELAEVLRTRGRDVIRTSLDAFQRPRGLRYARGSLDPRGYYEDAFDYHALRTLLLDPLGPGGDRRFRPASFDYRADTAAAARSELAARNAILVLDGVFLLRPELRAHWDIGILLEVPPEETLRRALERDVVRFGSPAAVEERYRTRYLPAQELYAAEARPAEHADAVVENADPDRPALRRGPPPSAGPPT
jgi:uridine kinase